MTYNRFAAIERQFCVIKVKRKIKFHQRKMYTYVYIPTAYPDIQFRKRVLRSQYRTPEQSFIDWVDDLNLCDWDFS